MATLTISAADEKEGKGPRILEQQGNRQFFCPYYHGKRQGDGRAAES